ncbi:MAG: hypothetical protein GYB66_00500 [Chloroflexi bacterium]|nr:hypothetical protein [Chloroflexota bacterium]
MNLPGRWLVMIGLVFGLASLLVITSRAIGLQRAHVPTYLDPGDCPQPCWRGVRPGTQSEALFWRQIATMTRYSGILTTDDQQTIKTIRLEMRGDILLGDVILALGPPSHARLRHIAGLGYTRSPAQRQLLVGASVYFGNGLVEAEVIREDDHWALSPDMIVRRIRYFAPHEEGTIVPIGTLEWHGFGSDY